MPDVPFDPATVVRVASDILSVKRVFGEPVERAGITIIPVAKVMGGSGGGGGQGAGPLAPGDADVDDTDADADDTLDGVDEGSALSGTVRADAGTGAVWQVPATGSGGGSGFGIHVRPVGVYVVDAQGVHWRPAIDVNRVILGGQVLGALVVLAVAHVLRRRR